MPKITLIEPQKKKSERVNVFIDGQFAFGLSLELVYEKKLAIGQVLNEQQIIDLVQADQVEKLTNKSLRFLSFRPRSEKEIRDNLLLAEKRKRKEEKSEIEGSLYEKSVGKVIEKLKRLDQVDDLEFARWWVEQRSRFNPKGAPIIKAELFKKGVDKEIINEVLNKEREEELALKFLEKKKQFLKRMDEGEFKTKMTQVLVRRGFTWEVAKKAVDTLLEEGVK
jgi:regulatory protein